MDKTTKIEVPVLVIGFNRPDVIRQNLKKLSESKPRNLYFACDAARSNKEGEVKLVNEVRSLMQSVEWECNVHYRFNDENKGCEVTVSSAISWVLEDNDYVIILEDDIVAPYSFLRFAQEMLLRYKDSEDVYMISGDNYTEVEFSDGSDYTFCMSGHIWGWATWKRAWKHFDLYTNDFSLDTSFLKEKGLSVHEIKRALSKSIELSKRKQEKRTWDIVWYYVRLRNFGLSIVPKHNLCSNNGIIGLHTNGATKQMLLPVDEEFCVKKHPSTVERNSEYDIYHYNNWLKQPPYLIKQFKRLYGFAKRNGFASTLNEISIRTFGISLLKQRNNLNNKHLHRGGVINRLNLYYINSACSNNHNLYSRAA